nr:receptor-like cytoplasmic kinase 176 [Tanacetum cinerariifolium]
IATPTIVPPREPISIVNKTDKTVVTLVYSRKPKSKNVSNKLEPNNSWGSSSSNVASLLSACRSSKSSSGTWTPASKTKSLLWHRRLSHFNFGAINHLARQGLVRGIPKLKFEKDYLCSACAMGKSTKKTHQPKFEDTNQEKLYLLHMDLCGPIRVESINGKKYILVIMDDYSRFIWVKFLRSKDETPMFIIKFLKMIQILDYVLIGAIQASVNDYLMFLSNAKVLDLEYLRYDSKGSRPALSISKMKAAYYPDVGLEKMGPDQMWIEEECKYDIAAMYGISHWWFQRQRFYIDRHISEGDRRAVRTHMWILSIVKIEVFSMYRYEYMKKIVLRRADLNEHIIAKRDFKYLYPSDFEDLYGVQMIMRFNEIHKFNDGTLHQIDEALDYQVKEFKVNRMNPSLNTRFWTRKDVDKRKEFMFAFQKRLKTRRIFRNLESFVGGRVAVCSSLRSLKPKCTIKSRAKRSSKIISLGHYSIMLASSHTVKMGFDSLVHSFHALSTMRRFDLHTASAAAKPRQGDSSKLYLITGKSSYVRPLSWSRRIKVALDVANALAYLHSQEAKVVHQDFKSSSILLDSDYNAKLCILWLAKDGPVDGNSHISTRVGGTNGYAAPECIDTVTYTFGVVLLEILIGRHCIDKKLPPGEQMLVEFAKSYLKKERRVLKIIDSEINGQYSSDVAIRASELAMKCLLNEPMHRPTAAELVKELEQLQVQKPV